MTRRRPWDEEADAADRLAATLGGKATRRDVAGAPAGTHDYDIVLDDRVIALEVTQHAVGPILAQRALEEKLDWSFDELRFCWSVNVREPCDLHRLRSEIVDLLQTFEADGRDRWLSNQRADEAALDERLRRLGVKLIYRLTDTTPGEVLVGSASVGGSTSPEVIVDIVNDHANRPDNVAKLGAAAAARHLWIWIHSDHHQAVAAMSFDVLPKTLPGLSGRDRRRLGRHRLRSADRVAAGSVGLICRGLIAGPVARPWSRGRPRR